MENVWLEFFLNMFSAVSATFLLYDLTIKEILKGSVETLQLYELEKNILNGKNGGSGFHYPTFNIGPLH